MLYSLYDEFVKCVFIIALNETGACIIGKSRYWIVLWLFDNLFGSERALTFTGEKKTAYGKLFYDEYVAIASGRKTKNWILK